MYINPQQNRILHALLFQTNMMELKQELVWSFSNQRTSSSRELNVQEAQALISYLKNLDPKEIAAEKMRRKILSKAHKLRWELENGKIDMARLNGWCIAYGGFKKSLNQHTHDELVQLVTAFDKVYKHYISKVD